MRSFENWGGLTAVALVASLGLAGCDAATTTTTTTNVIAEVQALTASTQAGLATACAFVPTAETISALATASSASAAATNEVASTIATEICNSIKTKSARPGLTSDKPPVVNGVTIQGYFVQK